MLCFTRFLLSLHKNSTDMKHLDIKRALNIKGLTIKELAERLEEKGAVQTWIESL